MRKFFLLQRQIEGVSIRQKQVFVEGIAEASKSWLRNARAKGKRIGRPKVIVDAAQVLALRNAGCSWSAICRQTGLTKGTAQRSVSSLPKNHFPTL
jgi:DNA invertase Pin-like site-specific DNA recombinase